MFKNPFHLFKKLCLPAQIYFVLSFISITSLFYQNYSDPHKYCVGLFSAKTKCNNKVYFLFKLIYIVFWTYILQLLCKKGYKSISWLLLLLPFLFMFIGIAIVLITLLRK